MIRTSHGLAGTWPTFASGTVIAALLNDAADPALMGPQADAAPYKGAPKLPVLGVRPPACVQITDDALWTVAEASQTVQLGAGIGMVVGRPAVRVTPVQALACVAGYVLCNDGSWPVPNPVHKHYRPGLRWRARDGLCVLSTRMVMPSAGWQADDLEISIRINGQQVHQGKPLARVRSAAQLLSEVSQFMTLNPGDVLLLGPCAASACLQVGQRVEIVAAGFGSLSTRLALSPSGRPATGAQAEAAAETPA